MNFGYSAGQMQGAPGNFEVFGDLLVDGTIPGMTTGLVYVDDNRNVLASDTGTTFIVAGGSGVTFTLPASPVEGAVFDFVNTDDEAMTVESTTAYIVANGEDQATSISFVDTIKIGAACRVIGTAQGWVAFNMSDLVMTANT